MKQVPLSFSRHVDEVLLAYDLHIMTFAKQYAVLTDAEDLAQLLRIKLAAALVKSDVHNVYWYLKTIAYHEYVNAVRSKSRRFFFSLPLTDEGEIQRGNWLNDMPISEGMGDPQMTLDEAASFYQRLGQLVRAILGLPPTQQRAAICVLRDYIDYPVLFAEAFQHYGVDISSSKYQWPTDPIKKQTLQASYAPVRYKLAQIMNIDLTAYKKRSCKHF